MNKIQENRLKEIASDLLWMAARYAHGRHTFAPSTVREAVKDLKKMWPDFRVKEDPVIEVPKPEEVGGISFRSDYLDDVFNPTSK